MQTPEGLMRTIIGHCEEVEVSQHGDLWCRTHINKLVDGICPEADATLDLIRAHDTEVRADERAKALAEVKDKALDHRQIITEGPLVSRLLVSHWCNEALLNPAIVSNKGDSQ